MYMVVSSNSKFGSHSVHSSSHGNQTVGRRCGREFKPQRKRQNQLQLRVIISKKRTIIKLEQTLNNVRKMVQVLFAKFVTVIISSK